MPAPAPVPVAPVPVPVEEEEVVDEVVVERANAAMALMRPAVDAGSEPDEGAVKEGSLGEGDEALLIRVGETEGVLFAVVVVVVEGEDDVGEVKGDGLLMLLDRLEGPVT